jgi:ATP-dependent Clp protease ATP-binding subunit ClpX
MSRYRNAYCSFCRKSYRDVSPLVEGPDNVYVCGECVELCTSIIEQERRRRERAAGTGSAATSQEVLRTRLGQLISDQAEAREALVMAAGCRGVSQCHVLLIGPSQGSRIFLARALAHVLEVPFVAGDLPSLLPSAGHAVTYPLVYNLMQAGGYDVQAAQQGVVYVDGADRQEIQGALLSLWRRQAIDITSDLRLDIQRILFICGGKFDGLDEVIARSGRHPEQPLTPDALIAFGAHQEWVRQLGVVARAAPMEDYALARMAACVDFRRIECSPLPPGKP